MSSKLDADLAPPAGSLPPGEPTNLAGLVNYQDNAVVSRTLTKKNGGTLTLFAFDAGQGLSEHSAPFDATVLVLDGVARVTVGGKPVVARVGEAVLMPANIPHAVTADERFKMLLAMVRTVSV